MSYTKNIAVIKGLQSGFSADGGALSGLVKAERYAAELKVEVSLINFAPLTEGRYVAAISDGPHTEIIEGGFFEGKSLVNTDEGFAAAVFYVNSGVKLLASAVSGNFQAALFSLKGEIERAEALKKPLPSVEEKKEKSAAPVGSYEDEALAEVNYYEFKSPDEGCQPVCEDTQKKEKGHGICPDETGSYPCEEASDGLARGGFYDRMRLEIEGLFSTYPPAEELCAAVDGSRWVKISYGDDNFYVFGVIYSDGQPKYICYGIPAKEDGVPPASLQGLASFLSVKTQYGEGFWVMYQDADTGASVSVAMT